MLTKAAYAESLRLDGALRSSLSVEQGGLRLEVDAPPAMTADWRQGRVEVKAVQPCAAWLEKPVYWSTIQYARHWSSIDGIWVKEIAQHGLNPATLQRIAINYNVNRGLAGAEIDPEDATGKRKIRPSLDRLCALFKEGSEAWPDGLLDRMGLCLRITAEAQALGCFVKPKGKASSFQVSAISKFMWFVKPAGWTVFDQYAALGLDVMPMLNQGARMQAFYRRLHQLGFEELTRDMQAVIDGTQVRGMPATRIIDTLLMARGRFGGDVEAVRACGFYLDLIPEGGRLELHRLAERLQTSFSDHLLTSSSMRAS